MICRVGLFDVLVRDLWGNKPSRRVVWLEAWLERALRKTEDYFSVALRSKEAVMRNRPRLGLSVIAAACLLVPCVSTAAQMEAQGNDKSKNINRIIHLEPPESAERGATGIAKISSKVKGKKPKQTFHVVGANLKIGSTYDLFVNGAKIASKKAAIDSDEAEEPGEEGAAVEFFFSSRAQGPSDVDDEEGQRPLPASLNPVTNIKKVELKDSTGKVVLTGEFPAS